jgi:hypothetical protein
MVPGNYTDVERIALRLELSVDLTKTAVYDYLIAVTDLSEQNISKVMKDMFKPIENLRYTYSEEGAE